jgi:porin
MNSSYSLGRLIACFLSITFSSSNVFSQTPVATETTAEKTEESALVRYFSQDYMLGDWGGRRTELRENGIDVEFFYFGSVPTNLEGGIREGSVYQHALLFALDLDTEKLGWWKDGKFHASGVWLEGDPFSTTYVGDFNKTNLVDFPGDWRLWELYYEHKAFDDKLTLKAGLLSVDRDFITPEMYNTIGSINFLNQTFFFPTLVFNLYEISAFPRSYHSLPSTPYSSLGVVVNWDFSKSLYARAGIYDGNPDQTTNGFNGLAIRAEEGALSFYEVGFRVNQDKDDMGLPGVYKFGAYYHSDEFFDMYDTVGSLFGFAAATTHDGNYGAYFLAEQMLSRELGKDDVAQQGLLGFFRLTAAPADRNLAEFGVDGGVVYKGLIPGRDWDTLGLAGSYLQMSEELKKAQRVANTIVPGFFVVSDYEAVVELNYKLQIAAWWTLSTSLQYAMHPGGSGAIDNAWVLGIQTTLRF